MAPRAGLMQKIRRAFPVRCAGTRTRVGTVCESTLCRHAYYRGGTRTRNVCNKLSLNRAEFCSVKVSDTSFLYQFLDRVSPLLTV